MLSVEISTEKVSIDLNIFVRVWRYLCRSVTRRMSNIPSVYAGMQSSTAVLCEGNDVASMPCHPDGVVCMPRHLLRWFAESSGLWYTSGIWPYAGRAQSTYLYGTEIWLTSLAPTNEESSWLNEEKNLNRVKKWPFIEWEWSLDTNNH